jgi:hypothetical protein
VGITFRARRAICVAHENVRGPKQWRVTNKRPRNWQSACTRASSTSLASQHLRRVVGVLLVSFPDVSLAEIEGAWLHDILEDHRGNTIIPRFGRGFGGCLTDGSDARTARRFCYLDWIRVIAASGDQSVIRVKLADIEDHQDPRRVAALPAGPASSRSGIPGQSNPAASIAPISRTLKAVAPQPPWHSGSACDRRATGGQPSRSDSEYRTFDLDRGWGIKQYGGSSLESREADILGSRGFDRFGGCECRRLEAGCWDKYRGVP